MPPWSLELVLLIACAVFYYRLAVFEKAPPVLWAALSVGTFIFTLVGLKWGLLGIIAGQVGLFVGIIVVRAVFGKGGMA
jgi:hypothetical protein